MARTLAARDQATWAKIMDACVPLLRATISSVPCRHFGGRHIFREIARDAGVVQRRNEGPNALTATCHRKNSAVHADANGVTSVTPQASTSCPRRHRSPSSRPATLLGGRAGGWGLGVSPVATRRKCQLPSTKAWKARLKMGSALALSGAIGRLSLFNGSRHTPLRHVVRASTSST